MANDDVIINIRVQLEQAKKQLKDVSKSVKSSMTDIAKSQQVVYTRTQQLNKALGKTQFQGWALSIMFFGMALKQMFNTVWQFGSKTFNEIMHSVEGTVTGFDTLNNSVTYLGFVVGQALEPIASFLAPIIDMITEWILNNQTLFATILVIVGVLGTVLTLVGGLVLGVAGLVTAWGIAGGAIMGVLALVAGSFLPITIAIVAIIALIALWKTNFGGFKDYIISIFTVVWEFLKSIWTNISGIFSGFIKIVKGLFTGDLALILDGAKQLFDNFMSLVLKAFFGFGAMLSNSMTFTMNLVTDIIASAVKLIMGLFAKTADLMGFTGIANKIKDGIKAVANVQANLQSEYITGDQVASVFNGVDLLSGTGSNTSTTNTTVNNYTINASTVDQSLLDRINQEIGARTP